MKVLFIGNSYTFFNDLPKTFAALATECGKACEVLSVTKGGRHLYENLLPNETTEELERVIAQNDFDLLVLQEQSFFALVDEERFISSAGELIRKINPRRTVLYCTWGRQCGAPLLDERGWTSEGMTDMLYKAYGRCAEANSADLCPVGLCFGDITQSSGAIDLYNPDKSHPSRLGTCLSAVAHYATVFGELPATAVSLGIDGDTLSVFYDTVRKYCL